MHEYHAIESLLQKRDVKKAEILIAKVLRTGNLNNEDQANLLLLRARAKLVSARPDDAIDDLINARSILTSRFEEPQNLELLADCYFARFELSSVGFADRNDAKQAESIYRSIIEKFSTYHNLGWIFYQLGRVLLTSNQIENAVGYLQKALLSPSDETALTSYCYERLGFVAFYEQRELDQALALLNKAVDTYPMEEDRLWLVQIHILRSRVFREMYKYDKALKAAETALSIAERADQKLGLSEALFTVAELLSKLEGREKDVAVYLQQFMQVSKKPLGVDVAWSRVYEMFADAQFKLGQYDEAASSYLMALQFNPYHPWEMSIYFRIARSYYQKRNYEKAVEAIQRMLAAAADEGQDVSDYRVFDVLGNAQFALGNYAKAAEAYQVALDIAPPNAENLEKIKSYHRFAQEHNRAL